THPPLLVIEILSKDDTLRAMRERVDDYVVFGIRHIWLVDPGQRSSRLRRTGHTRAEPCRHTDPH
ncbi:MAG TPA: Uma2 family endonuclease, partial [Candidatus Acidoferrales bacterium]|nr:Uma2 family endonuclease [Candidatus Acidoferrales bacterium]